MGGLCVSQGIKSPGGEDLMLTIEAVFYALILLFGIIGMSRGWVREALATAGILLAMFILQTFGDKIVGAMIGVAGIQEANRVKFFTFIVKASIFGFITFFAYYGPAMARPPTRLGFLQRAQLGIQETLLGFIFGLLNGYLIAGNLWFYLKETGYPLPPELFIWYNPREKQALTEAGQRLARYLPPEFLKGMKLYGVFALFILFVIIALT